MSSSHDTTTSSSSSCQSNNVLEKPTTKEEKELRAEILRNVLPACQPQEGSPANTFTESELQELQASIPGMMKNLRPRTKKDLDPIQQMNIISGPWEAPHGDCPQEAPQEQEEQQQYQKQQPPLPLEAPQSGESEPLTETALNWHGAPKFDLDVVNQPRSFRQLVREGKFTGPTNAQCPGFLQCNLVVLPKEHAFDFLLFCQRNPKACPLIEVCDVGSPCPVAVAPDADLRTDCPKYAIYRDGELEQEVDDATEFWPEDSVAFLIGCSFSYDGALLNAGIPLRSAEQGKNVPMYNTNLACRSAGSLSGNMVVSMKPIPALKISKHVEVTAKFPHAHGGPICIGRPDILGIYNIDQPDWGDAVEIGPDEVPVFHACGVTPQAVLKASRIPFAITHAAGHMFVTDLPSDMGVV